LRVGDVIAFLITMAPHSSDQTQPLEVLNFAFMKRHFIGEEGANLISNETTSSIFFHPLVQKCLVGISSNLDEANERLP
jgi:hypothetical protein